MKDSFYEVVSVLDKQFQSADCIVWRDPHLESGKKIALFVTKVRWSLVRIPIHVFVQYIGNPNISDYTEYLDEGTSYSRRAFSQGVLKRAFSTLAIVPLIVCDSPSKELISFVKKRHRAPIFNFKGSAFPGGLSYYPVLYSLDSKEIFYWKGFDFVGSGVWPFSRKLIEENIAKALVK